MADRLLERAITRILRVPPQPEPPLGSPASVRVFNAAPGFYRYRLAQWGLRQAGTLFGLVFGLVMLGRFELGPLDAVARAVAGPMEMFAALAFVVQLPVTFLMVGIDYRYRWYMVTDTSLRIREGLVAVHERTMTFANIQNLSLRQGPLQRMFGIADLRVRTAGGGGQDEAGESHTSESANMHLGYFRGVDNAAEIRDMILGRMRGWRDSGLGDPDEVPSLARDPRPSAITPAVLAAARALRDEAHHLHAALGGQGDAPGSTSRT